MPLPITAVGVALFALAMVALGIVVIRARRAGGTSLGVAQDEPLTRAVRAQGNFFEYTVPALALVALCEAGGASPYLTAPLLAAFVAARAAHVYALLVAEPRGGARRFSWRVRAMGMTFACLILLVALLGLVALGVA
ncbi:MAG: MAPEG family protein [Pseudomonadota bacterium]